MENFVYLTINYICSKLRLSQLRQLNNNPWIFTEIPQSVSSASLQSCALSEAEILINLIHDKVGI